MIKNSKFSICLLVTILSLSISKGQDKSLLILQGRIKSVTETSFYGKNLSITESKKVYKFNERGKLIEVTEFGENDKLGAIETYLYDNNDSLVLKKRASYYGGHNIEYIKKEYDQLGNKILETQTDSSGKVKGRISYKYKNSQLVEKSFFNRENSVPDVIMVVENDAKGRLIKETSYGRDKKAGAVILYTYDDRGNILTYLWKSATGQVVDDLSYTYKYFPNGRVKEKSIFTKKKFSSKHMFDEIGNNLSNKSSDFDSVHKLENFDKSGNWLKRTDIDDGDVSSVIIRVIEYYQ